VLLCHVFSDGMLADFMSKPLQGSLFHKFRNVLMGWTRINALFKHSASNEERVENTTNNGD